MTGAVPVQGATEASGGPWGRRRRSPGAPASAAWGLTAVFTAANLTLLGLNSSTRSPAGPMTGPSELLSGLGYFVLGCIGVAVLVRRRDNGAGWVFLVVGLSLSIAALASEYATYGLLTDPGRLPGAEWFGWVGAWVWWAAAAAGLGFGLLLYPDGALPSARWRVWARVALVNTGLLALLHAFAPGRLDGEYSLIVNPAGVGDPENLLRQLRGLAWLLVLANAVIGTAAVRRRLQTAREADRRQLSGLAAAGVAAAAAALLWGVAGGGDGAPSAPVQLVVVTGLLAVPVTVAAAIARTATLRRSVQRLVLAREEERRRIRRDLHDGLGPTLAGVGLQLELARSLVGTDQAAVETILERLAGQVKLAVGDIRRLVDDLRPPVLDQLGLVSAIRESTSYLARHTNDCPFEVSVEATGNMSRLPAVLEVTAFRIVMEAVTNACRHGSASACEVHLSLDSALQITVEDDGVGLPEDYEPGVGLSSMRERAAEIGGICRVQPRPGGGTVVQAELPVAPA